MSGAHSGGDASQMVALLRERGVRDSAVIDAMARVPRELFVTDAEQAYSDAALPIDCCQTISQPFMVAKMTELLALTRDARVLEIGTGSGYQTAILAQLAAGVCTVEWHMKLLLQAAERLERLQFRNIEFRCGDGSRGWPERAPFDAIIVTAGGPQIPAALEDQLKLGGRLVIPVGPLEDQVLVRVIRAADGFRREEILKCRFVKLRGMAGWDE